MNKKIKYIELLYCILGYLNKGKGVSMNYYIYENYLGKFYILEMDGFITGLSTDEKDIPSDSKEYLSEPIKDCIAELEMYFKGELKRFTVPIVYNGTKFQESVWNALLNIPYGETRSYQEVAEEVGSEKAVRAVGGANNKNPLMILIPCHRVIGKDGSLVGFGGGLELKSELLNLESLNKGEK